MEEIKTNYKKYRKDIKSRLKEFEKVQHPELFYEICFCLTTPQSNAKKCHEAVCHLTKKGFLNKNLNLNQIKKVLQPRTRFYQNKSNYLLLMKDDYKEIQDLFNSKLTSIELRDKLVQNIKGMGMKESSHFLRNIGFKNLAILDRHILKNLVKHKVLKEIPKSLSKKTYLEIESKFQNFSKKVNIPMDELDLLFWATETGEVFK